MFYLGVQCEHPIQFLMVGWLSALVFSNIVYTLTLSFGDIGKAIAVVLLVMQVAGSGGTFPIETLPTFFQVVSKWLLFPYAVDAMHSAMAGSFGMEYWVSMGKLALFLVPSLLLGLMLRKPVIRFNDWVIRNLEKHQGDVSVGRSVSERPERLAAYDLTCLDRNLSQTRRWRGLWSF